MSWSHPDNGYRQTPQQIAVGDHVVYNPTDADLRAAGWHEDQFVPAERFQAPATAPSFGSDGIAYWLPHDLPLAEAQQQARDLAYQSARDACEALAGRYHPSEQARWTRLTDEVRAYRETGTAPVFLAAAAGDDLERFAAAVEAKASQYEAALAAIIAERDRTTAAIDAAADVDALRRLGL